MSPPDHDNHNDDRQNRDGAAAAEHVDESRPDESLSDESMDPADPAEIAQATAFAGLIDTVIAGDKLPAVMAAEQREMVETAAILRANLRADGSVGSGVSSVVGRVMSQVSESSQEQEQTQQGDSGIIDFQARRRRRVRWLSAGTAALAAAAVLFFVLRSPGPPASDSGARPVLSMIHHSRPADPLIGEIPREQADRASDRLDTIYADRMAGYRDLRLRGGAQ